MPRPSKCRQVCAMPKIANFNPVGEGGAETGDEIIVMTVDEYETIRLIDQEGFSQEECGAYMQIARTTVQQIYTSARKKMADMLVNGIPLRIEGGNFRLCDGKKSGCACSYCPKQQADCPKKKNGPFQVR